MSKFFFPTVNDFEGVNKFISSLTWLLSGNLDGLNIRVDSGTALPIATEGQRGQFFILRDTLPDELYVCLKQSDNTYDWKQVTVS